MDNDRKISYGKKTQYQFSQSRKTQKLSNGTTEESQKALREQKTRNISQKQLGQNPSITIERVGQKKEGGFLAKIAKFFRNVAKGFKQITQPKGSAKKAHKFAQTKLQSSGAQYALLSQKDNKNFATLGRLEDAIDLLKDVPQFTDLRDRVKKLITSMVSTINSNEGTTKTDRMEVVALLDSAITEVTKKETIKEWKQLKNDVIKKLSEEARRLIELVDVDYTGLGNPGPNKVLKYMGVATGIGADLARYAGGARDKSIEDIIDQAKSEIVILKHAASITPSKTTRKELEAGIQLMEGHLAKAEIASENKPLSRLVTEFNNAKKNPARRGAYFHAAVDQAADGTKVLKEGFSKLVQENQHLKSGHWSTLINTTKELIENHLEILREAVKQANDPELAWALQAVKEEVKTLLTRQEFKIAARIGREAKPVIPGANDYDTSSIEFGFSQSLTAIEDVAFGQTNNYRDALADARALTKDLAAAKAKETHKPSRARLASWETKLENAVFMILNKELPEEALHQAVAATIDMTAPEVQAPLIFKFNSQAADLIANVSSKHVGKGQHAEKLTFAYVDGNFKAIGDNIPAKKEEFGSYEDRHLQQVMDRIAMEKAVFKHAASVAISKTNKKMLLDGIKNLDKLQVAAEKRLAKYENHVALETPKGHFDDFVTGKLRRRLVATLAKSFGKLDTQYKETRNLIETFMNKLLREVGEHGAYSNFITHEIGAPIDKDFGKNHDQLLGGVIERIDIEVQILEQAKDIANREDRLDIDEHIEKLKELRPMAEAKLRHYESDVKAKHGLEAGEIAVRTLAKKPLAQIEKGIAQLERKLKTARDEANYRSANSETAGHALKSVATLREELGQYVHAHRIKLVEERKALAKVNFGDSDKAHLEAFAKLDAKLAKYERLGIDTGNRREEREGVEFRFNSFVAQRARLVTPTVVEARNYLVQAQKEIQELRKLRAEVHTIAQGYTNAASTLILVNNRLAKAEKAYANKLSTKLERVPKLDISGLEKLLNSNKLVYLALKWNEQAKYHKFDVAKVLTEEYVEIRMESILSRASTALRVNKKLTEVGQLLGSQITIFKLADADKYEDQIAELQAKLQAVKSA